MRWKRVVWAGWLAPALGGCHTTGPAAAPGLPSGGLVAHTQAAIEHRIRTDAREAWNAVRAEYPRRAFTAEFRDGFLDGYTDHLDRGGDGTPPPTPPVRYTRHARYFTPEGHLLLKDYFLGFKYGADVAAATGQRQFLTVPVLVPDAGPSGVVVTAGPAQVPAAPTTPTLPASPVPPPAPSVPPSDRPPPQPLPPPTPEPTTARPAARPPLPVGAKVGPGGAPSSTPAAEPEPVAVPVSLPVPRLPAPPAAVPTLPAHVPTPPVTDDLPVMPPAHDLPPPLPVVHPEPTR